jgi:riboflavin kinase / FMN adenylyltransferase
MQVFRGIHHPTLAPQCALTIGNFDGVHRGHQAMLALLRSEAQHRGLPACVMTFEPHPREYFARQQPTQSAPARIATLRDKLSELERCGVDQVVVLRFGAALASAAPAAFVDQVITQGLGARYVLVGNDFRFGAKRSGDYALLDQAGARYDFDVARMNSYEVHGLRVSSSAVREALACGNLAQAQALLGRPYSISGHVVHGQKLGRQLGFHTLNVRFAHSQCAASGIFVVRTHGLAEQPLEGVASLGVRPTVDNSGRILLEVHCLRWPEQLGLEEGYGKIIQVQLLHKLRDEAHYAGLTELTTAIAQDALQARLYFQALGTKNLRPHE